MIEANNEAELWKIANEVTNPKKASEWIIEINGDDVKDKYKYTESGKSWLAQRTCLNDAIRIWNKLPSSVTSCETFNQIKCQAKLFAKSLPV